MFCVVRRSQTIGLITGRNCRFETVEKRFFDENGQVVYFASSHHYRPKLPSLNRMAVRSSFGDPLGWVEDCLYDWKTGDIAAYIVSGDIAALYGGEAVLYPEDVKTIDVDAIALQDGAQSRLKNKSEGLKEFLSEKSQQLKNWLKTISQRVGRALKAIWE